MAAESNLEDEDRIHRELGLLKLCYETLSDYYNTIYYFQYAKLTFNCCLAKENITESLSVFTNFQPFLRVKVVSRVDKTRSPPRKYE